MCTEWGGRSRPGCLVSRPPFRGIDGRALNIWPGDFGDGDCARGKVPKHDGFGVGMLICSPFFANSNCAGLNCEKSRFDRSWARNASACLSVLSVGTFFFIRCSLLCVHIPGRQWAQYGAVGKQRFNLSDRNCVLWHFARLPSSQSNPRALYGLCCP